MRSRLFQEIVRGMGLLVILGLQVYSGYWQLLFTERIELLAFNASTLSMALIEAALSVASGVLLAMILFSRMVQITSLKISGTILVISILLPISGLIIKGIAAVEGLSLFPMSFMFLWNWAIFSPAPSLWLGIALASLIQRLRT
jgi:hypothetical protein